MGRGQVAACVCGHYLSQSSWSLITVLLITLLSGKAKQGKSRNKQGKLQQVLVKSLESWALKKTPNIFPLIDCITKYGNSSQGAHQDLPVVSRDPEEVTVKRTGSQKISQQLRHSQRRSLRDYNLQVEKMHRILAELKSSSENPGHTQTTHSNAAGHKSTPFQKLLVKIRSIF
ncbi:hypothetical protein Ddc_12968 [Ditylenchus destructor]|nr:hypothetical protein Ddc_12968 [Ditylenchus destructor]